ncbi:hypothetical protein D3C87_1742550 [compost metagenome]
MPNTEMVLHVAWCPAEAAEFDTHRVIRRRGDWNRAGATNLALRFHQRLAVLIPLDRQPFAPDCFTGQAVTELIKEAAAIRVALVRVHVPANVG